MIADDLIRGLACGLHWAELLLEKQSVVTSRLDWALHHAYTFGFIQNRNCGPQILESKDLLCTHWCVCLCLFLHCHLAAVGGNSVRVPAGGERNCLFPGWGVCSLPLKLLPRFPFITH